MSMLSLLQLTSAAFGVLSHNSGTTKVKEAFMKTMLCIVALLVLTATTADAYVRRTIGGGYVVRGAGANSGRYAGGYYGRGYYGNPVARGAAVAAGAAAVAGTYYGGGYGTDDYYGAYAADPAYDATYVAEPDYGAYAGPAYYGT